MDLAIYQDLFLDVDAFGQNFNTALQAAVDAWTNGFGFFGDNTTTAEAGTATDATALSSQFGWGADASTEAGTDAEAAGDAGLELDVNADVDANL